MNNKKRLFFSAVLLLALIFVFYFITKAITFYTGYSVIGESADSEKAEKLALCLKEENSTMFGAYWCPHCQNQKKMFGSSFQYINYIECTENKELCSTKGISGYPTWEISGNLYSGEKTFEELEQLAHCKEKEVKIEKIG